MTDAAPIVPEGGDVIVAYGRARVQIMSMVEISRQKIESLAAWLERVSPETAEALRQYELRPSLFEWREFVSR